MAESRTLRFFTFTILYIAQGLPFGLVSYALPAYLAMDRRRPWVIIAQIGLVATGIAFAFFPEGLENIAVLTTLCLLLNVFSANQDVAVALAVRERPGEKLLPWTSGNATKRSMVMKAESWG
ncbi:MAG: hypothetical protein PVF63_03750 [Gammaproteobacteria bacterium]